jgi:hypothetical protein
MPPLAPAAARKLSEVLQQAAQLVAELGGLRASERFPAHEHGYVAEVTARFEAINRTLKEARESGHVSAEQQRSIAENLEAAAAAIEKAAGSSRG